MTLKILCAFDQSTAAQKAFDFAMTLARSFDGALHVLGIFQPAEAERGPNQEALLDAARKQFSASFERLAGQAASAGVPVNFAASVGYPAQQILHHAQQLSAAHIVVGCRGKSQVDRWSMGSVSHRVASQASCPVTVVR